MPEASPLRQQRHASPHCGWLAHSCGLIPFYWRCCESTNQNGQEARPPPPAVADGHRTAPWHTNAVFFALVEGPACCLGWGSRLARCRDLCPVMGPKLMDSLCANKRVIRKTPATRDPEFVWSSPLPAADPPSQNSLDSTPFPLSSGRSADLLEES